MKLREKLSIYALIYFIQLTIINGIGISIFVANNKSVLLIIPLGMYVLKLANLHNTALCVFNINTLSDLYDNHHIKKFIYIIMCTTMLQLDYILGYIVLYYYGLISLIIFSLEIFIILIILFVVFVASLIFYLIT